MRKIGIIAAMPVEVEPLKNKFDDICETKIAGYTYFSSCYKAHDVVLCACGIGKVSAALCTQIMIDSLDVDCVINIGIAGSFRQNVKHLDVVLSSEVTYYDVRKTQMINAFSSEVFKADGELLLRAHAA